MDLDYYEILNLHREANQEEIREAYFTAARLSHPDVNPDPQAVEKFMIVQKAYQVLSNPESRLKYDQTLTPLPSQPGVKVDFQFSRSVLPRIGEPQLLYVLMDILPIPEPEKTKLPPSNICLVLDRSTSMQGERMDMVKTSAMRLIKALKPQDWVSVIIYNDRAEILIPPTQVQEIHALENRINLIKTGGGTELFHGLQYGFEQISMMRGLNTIKELILLTDGHTYGDEMACLSLAENASTEGVTITAIGIGDEWNDEFLDKLASNTGGSAFYIQNNMELSNIFYDKVALLNLLYAKRLKFTYSLGDGIELRYAFRVHPESTPLTIEESCLHLGNLYYRNHQLILLEFMIKELPVKEEEMKILKGGVWMDIAGGMKNQAYLPINITLPIRLNPDLKPVSPQIKEALLHLSLYRMQEKARNEVDDGKIDQAMRHLQYLATNLFSIGKRDLAQSVLLEAEHVHQAHTYSQNGSKAIKYGTRALFLPSGLESENDCLP